MFCLLFVLFCQNIWCILKDMLNWNVKYCAFVKLFYIIGLYLIYANSCLYIVKSTISLNVLVNILKINVILSKCHQFIII